MQRNAVTRPEAQCGGGRDARAQDVDQFERLLLGGVDGPAERCSQFGPGLLVGRRRQQCQQRPQPSPGEDEVVCAQAGAPSRGQRVRGLYRRADRVHVVPLPRHADFFFRFALAGAGFSSAANASAISITFRTSMTSVRLARFSS